MSIYIYIYVNNYSKYKFKCLLTKDQLKCVNPLTHRNICWYNKGRLLYNLFLYMYLYIK